MITQLKNKNNNSYVRKYKKSPPLEPITSTSQQPADQ